ncbi:MAG: hypothetical protein CMF31_06065 [Kordiimonas sp.]|nr:hypothetical protein [Kordiimonas sp.]|tara:strand:+ start:4646 stop:5455 length:810 start_codon:yes stop_codon:yes gene_type:complete
MVRRPILFNSLPALLIIIVVCWALPARAERVVADLSDDVIEITSRFSGKELLIFGALDIEIPQADGGHGIRIEGESYDIIVVVESPRQDFVVRKKEKFSLIWVNAKARDVHQAPAFYAVSSTRPLRDILSAEQLRDYQIGLDYLDFGLQDGPDEEGVAADYTAGLLRNMQAKGLYTQSSGTVSIMEEALFRSRLLFPANVPVGNYQVVVYLIRGGEMILSQSTPLLVDKRGIERFVYEFAHRTPALYGIIAVFVALFAGWVAGMVSQRS